MNDTYSSGDVMWAVISAVMLTLLGVLAARNFIGGEKKVERRLKHLYSLADDQFAHELGVLLGPPLMSGNLCKILKNGDEIFPAMLDAIRSAHATITFETYIYWGGEIGKEFAAALCERASAGVKVHVLLDWLGTIKMKETLVDELRAAGIRVHRYHAPRWYQYGRLNNRTHRKLLIVDGRIGFTGGVGIAPEWTGHAQDPDHWRDSHFSVEGPVVAQMQAVFLDNWIKVSGEVLRGTEYFPKLAEMGDDQAQVFSSSPEGGSESMELMYLLAITSASISIDLSAAYFVPSKLTLEALVAATERGVKLRVIVPGEHIDSGAVRSASRSTWGPLLARGALIAEYEPTMYHCKVMIVDGLLVSVGSTNFDNRSFRLNDEATLNIVSPTFASRQTTVFEEDLQCARTVTYQAWKQRPVTERMKEFFASIVGSQL